MAFTKADPEELRLPRRAIVTFATGDLKALVSNPSQGPIKAWLPLRAIFQTANAQTIVTRSSIGGPNVAALVEELSTFGVQEFILWGYCGGLTDNVRIGDVLTAEKALREDGVSYHYLSEHEKFVTAPWFGKWSKLTAPLGFRPASVWSCDALYRETRRKIVRYREMGIQAVEMEVASFYAVCRARHLKGIAFLVVSDLFKNDAWIPGFFGPAVREGAKKVGHFLSAQGLANT